MTGKRLRQLADAVNDGDPWYLPVARGQGMISTRNEDEINFIAALGPDAARLLADAMDALACDHAVLRAQAGISPLMCGSCPPCVLHARFAALGEPS